MARLLAVALVSLTIGVVATCFLVRDNAARSTGMPGEIRRDLIQDTDLPDRDGERLETMMVRFSGHM